MAEEPTVSTPARQLALALGSSAFRDALADAFSQRPSSSGEEESRIGGYLRRIEEVYGPLEGVASKDQMALVSETLEVRLAFRGTDGSRISRDRVAEFYHLLRWERCPSCHEDHPVVLAMDGERVTAQVVVCDRSSYIAHIYGK